MAAQREVWDDTTLVPMARQVRRSANPTAIPGRMRIVEEAQVTPRELMRRSDLLRQKHARLMELLSVLEIAERRLRAFGEAWPSELLTMLGTRNHVNHATHQIKTRMANIVDQLEGR